MGAAPRSGRLVIPMTSSFAAERMIGRERANPLDEVDVVRPCCIARVDWCVADISRKLGI